MICKNTEIAFLYYSCIRDHASPVLAKDAFLRCHLEAWMEESPFLLAPVQNDKI